MVVVPLAKNARGVTAPRRHFAYVKRKKAVEKWADGVTSSDRTLGGGDLALVCHFGVCGGPSSEKLTLSHSSPLCFVLLGSLAQN
jgi:hypothetical protein